jgi:hypothetical protein
MRWFRRERTPIRDEDLQIVSLDRYDPCEIDPPAYMFVRLGAAVAIVLGLALAAEHLVRLTH